MLKSKAMAEAEKLPKQFDHKLVEPFIYSKWEKGNYFEAKIDKDKKPYTIVLPPPNASGKMHTGNVLMIAIEDLLIRWKRMQGYSALWVPGTDHAGFETQITYERKLKKEGKSRFDFDRKTLYQNIWDFVQENKGAIEQQMKDMGASVDWSRYTFTLDDHVINTVYKTFEKMHGEGLVYKDDYMVNYCPKCGTTFADLEIKHEERKDPLYYVKYPLVDRKDNEPEFVVCATVRPEPIFIDTHLAVNPKDKKNKWLVGRKVLNPLTNAEMLIIGDAFVDPEFGTGVVKLTPGHDKNDYEVAKKHDLPIITAIGIDGRIADIPEAGELARLKVVNARVKALELLEGKGLLEKVDDKYEHSVMVCYKGGHDIEPTVLPNWFVKVDTLKKPALDVVKKGKVKIYPKWREITYTRWMEEMHDWPISRQVVWGIRIPVWYSVAENKDLVISFIKDGQTYSGLVGDLLNEHTYNEIYTGLQTLIAPKNATYEMSIERPEGEFLQETDTFDTWFSSGHWPLVTLKYPDSEDFKYFYPTAVLETGWEIIRLWVSRMIMFGIYLTGKAPFNDVYLHGIVKALDGKKMSKSLGNVINPEEYQEKFGTDALRMGLIAGTANGKDFAFPKDKVVAYRNFGNKIWNMARFMLLMEEKYLEENNVNSMPELNLDDMEETFTEEDRNILNGLNGLIKNVNDNLEKYRFADASEAIYHFMWGDLASSYIEHVKEREDKAIALAVLRYAYKQSLKLLHPFMPFVTEQIWDVVKAENEDLLIVTSWPTTLSKTQS